ncbi:DUF1453 family protein, partial [Listeria monocytogenes]|nr:DUF1453 family protein [Listeria monocytogenes]
LIRIFIKYWISGSLEVGDVSGMFWILAFAMIVQWRIVMYFQYKNTEKELNKVEVSGEYE